MIKLYNQLSLPRCPHCHVDTPSLSVRATVQTSNYSNSVKKLWKMYSCHRCGGIVTASSLYGENGLVEEIFPINKVIDDSLPEKVRAYLSQALESLHAPAGALMLCASAVDAMLKEKNYLQGSLHVRINKAVEDNLITSSMGKWAHQIRLDANEQRHADEESTLPTYQDAKRALDFALALGEFLFVLPNKVTKGLEETST